MDVLCELLSCDVETGVITRRVSTRARWKAGQVVGSLREDGRILVKAGGIRCMAHRIVWYFAHGAMPDGEVGHINGDPGDNRIANLRLATRSQNAQNLRKPRVDNTSGFLGVSWNQKAARFRADITVDGKRKFLGHYHKAGEAYGAYLQAKARLHPFQTLVAP